jgi:PAS domain-containing protein
MFPDISRQGEFQPRLVPHLDLLIDAAFIVELKEGDPFVISGANTAFLHLMGFREKEGILGQSFEGYLDSSDKTPLFLPEYVAPDSSPEKEALRQERVLLRKDKSQLLSEIRMKRIMFGEIPLLLVTVRDITEMAQQGLFQEVGRGRVCCSS